MFGEFDMYIVIDAVSPVSPPARGVDWFELLELSLPVVEVIISIPLTPAVEFPLAKLVAVVAIEEPT